MGQNENEVFADLIKEIKNHKPIDVEAVRAEVLEELNQDPNWRAEQEYIEQLRVIESVFNGTIKYKETPRKSQGDADSRGADDKKNIKLR